MAGNLNEDHQRWILKTYWKYEKYAETVLRIWENKLHFPASSRLAIYRIRDKFETTSSVTNAPKSGPPHATLTEENEIMIAFTFVNSPKKSPRLGSWVSRGHHYNV
ncbi:uncharacterized protein TNIN_482881 [Trichonephila inaurata madagascariensis]|uniref:DUF4817 domain-containing protein n=1 Tax=Trichonephila inaurata madagascariensis TaxID=2747483 RepID=A0A8X6XS73_9ARAC|nr:uncharacterized protein TNIN_482881 [Trichonephila inaurata madagascariensis]